MRRVRHLRVDLESVELSDSIHRTSNYNVSVDVIGCLQPVSTGLRPFPAEIVLVRFHIPIHKFVDRVARLKSGNQPPGLFPTPGPSLRRFVLPLSGLGAATLATATACSIFAAWYGQTIFETQLTILTSAVALQGGYMIGLTSREFLVPSKRI